MRQTVIVNENTAKNENAAKPSKMPLKVKMTYGSMLSAVVIIISSLLIAPETTRRWLAIFPLDGKEVLLFLGVPSYVVLKKVWQKRHQRESVFSDEDMREWQEWKREGKWFAALRYFCYLGVALGFLIGTGYGYYPAFVNHQITTAEFLKFLLQTCLLNAVLFPSGLALDWLDNLDSEREYQQKHPEAAALALNA